MACPQLLQVEVSGGGLWVQFVMLLDFFVRWRRRLRGTRIGHCQRGPENNSTLINNDLSPGPTQKIGKGACVTLVSCPAPTREGGRGLGTRLVSLAKIPVYAVSAVSSFGVEEYQLLNS